MEKNSLALALACMAFFAMDNDSENSNDVSKTIRELHNKAASTSRQPIVEKPSIKRDNRNDLNKEENISNTAQNQK